MPDTTPTPQELADEAKRRSDLHTAALAHSPDHISKARDSLHAAIDRMREALEISRQSEREAWRYKDELEQALAAAQAGAGEVVGEIESYRPPSTFNGAGGYQTFEAQPRVKWALPGMPPVGAKLYTRPVAAQAAEVPAGCVVVPVEPTQSMIDALPNCGSVSELAAWSAMIAAAPPSPLARVPLTEWQSIETAPKDGTSVLGYWMGGKHDCAIHATKFWRGAWWEPNEDYPQCEPTHWMPLPAAPANGIAPQDGGGEGSC